MFVILTSVTISFGPNPEVKIDDEYIPGKLAGIETGELLVYVKHF